MKRRWVLMAVLAVALLLVPARLAYAWPEAIEGFIAAMQTGDPEGALAVLSDDAVIALPYELLPPDSKLVPAEQRVANGTLTLSGKAQIEAWLTEFTGRYNGRLYLQGPAHGEGRLITVKATVVADNVREVFANWPVGSVDLTIKGTLLTRVALTLPPETLQALRRANPQIYRTPPPARRGPLNGPRPY